MDPISGWISQCVKRGREWGGLRWFSNCPIDGWDKHSEWILIWLRSHTGSIEAGLCLSTSINNMHRGGDSFPNSCSLKQAQSSSTQPWEYDPSMSTVIHANDAGDVCDSLVCTRLPLSWVPYQGEFGWTRGRWNAGTHASGCAMTNGCMERSPAMGTKNKVKLASICSQKG